ncbi:MAG TPA: protein kinase, partial [Pyrinomonadaceae bacterium]|nr:protein kinase [Pyrinomonadaceae bacterium]
FFACLSNRVIRSPPPKQVREAHLSMKKCPRCGAEYSDTTTLCPADGAALETTGDPLIGETLAGKYRIEERLSVGGMGTVYRGTHILMGKTVAIKVLRPSLAADEKIVARFSREARAASMISHPHALSVTDFGEDEGGVVFLVMEFLNGRTLKQVIREDGPLPLSRTVEIMRQVGSALDAAHAEGVVHRDLKSDNIMLINASGADYAKVLDFGIAKIQETAEHQDPGLTSPDLIIGTPQYMSPEQCSQSEQIDSRTDIYSLGIILFEMLVGHVPFLGDSPTVIMLKHLQEQPPSVLDERKDLPVGIGTVVAKALAKQREERYQSASALVEDLVIAEGTGLVQPDLAQKLASGRMPPVATGRAPEPADDDEQTLVRPRVADYAPPPRSPAVRIPVPPPPPPASGFKPWRILIPSLAGLLVVFAVIYAFTRSNQQGANSNQGQAPVLSADPNSQAVQPAAPPTGANEQGIPLGGVAAASVNSNANANANASVSPTPADSENDNSANANSNSSPSTNANRAPELPSPRNTPAATPQSSNPLVPTPTLPPVSPKPTSTAVPPPPGR